MYLYVDLSVFPPRVELRDPDDFTSFAVRVDKAKHAWIAPEMIRSLAGSLSDRVEWREGFEQMMTFARRHGWVNEDGAVRAHIEYRTTQDEDRKDSEQAA